MGGGGFLFENFPPFHLSRCIYLVTRRLILEKGETISENGAIASRLPLFPILDHHLVNGHITVHLNAVRLKEVCTVSKARKAIRLTLSQQPRGWGRATKGHHGATGVDLPHCHLEFCQDGL